MNNTNKKNLVSGMRPTGQLHIGHYMGVLRNWVKLQNTEKYNNFFFVADWHTLTTQYSKTDELQFNINEVIKDFIACGLDPNKSLIYKQSYITEIAELNLLFSMICPHNWVEKDPTLKDLVRGAKNNNISELTSGMLGYPILQTADIAMFKGELIPVGKDQVAHLEISRDIVRKFNNSYNIEYFPECKPLLTDTPVLLGVDNTKMSKSFNNDIKLADSDEQTLKQVKKMLTDTNRINLTDRGNVKNCSVVYKYYEIFGNEEINTQVQEQCHNALRGCMACKKQLSELINEYLADIRIKRQSITDSDIQDILVQGNTQAKELAAKNIQEIRDIMKI